MDKIALNKEQLQQLVRYIGSRGFKDPLVVIDILDHFSCKVEEELTANPQMTLDTAMQRAHSSFGIKGFYPLAEASKGVLVNKCGIIYKAAKYDLLTSPLQLLVIITASLLFFFGYYRAAVTGQIVAFMDCNLITIFGYSLMIANALYVSIRFSKNGNLSQIVNEACMKADRRMLVFMFIIAFIMPLIPIPFTPLLLSASRTIVFSCVLVWQWSKYLTIKRVIRSFKLDFDAIRPLIAT